MDNPDRADRRYWATIAILWLLLLAAPPLRSILVDDARSLTEQPTDFKATLFDLGLMNWPAEPRRQPASSPLVAAARSHPSDYPMQLAAALDSGSPTTRLNRLDGLIQRYPSRPSAYAAYLGYAALSDVRIRRDRDEDIFSTGKAIAPAPDRVPPARLLATYDRYALLGQRLDPQNCYFPIMRAVGLFASHRDAEAVASIKLAATATTWNDYSSDETTGRWRLRAAAYNETNAIDRSMVADLTLHPQFSVVRAACRIATLKAIEAAQAGNPSEELGVRQAVMRCGDLMRADSSSTIGAAVGVASTAIATYRPGGVLPTKRPDTVSEEQWAAYRREQYFAYATRVGAPQVAALAREETTSATQSREILKREPLAFNMGGENFFRLIAYRIVGMIILANAFWFCLISIIVRGRTSKLRSVAVFFAGALTMAAAGLTMFQWAATATAMWDVISDLSTSQSGEAIPPIPIGIFAAAITTIPAALISVVTRGYAGSRREPFAIHAARVFPIACVVCLAGFTILAAVNARLDKETNLALDRCSLSEPAYIASRGNIVWPKAVSFEYYLAHLPNNSAAIPRKTAAK